MKRKIFFLFFFALQIAPFIYSVSTDSQLSNRQYQIGLQILETIQFTGAEHLLNMGYRQEDFSAYIARKLVPEGLVIGIEPNEKLAERANHDYRGINNLHIVHMDGPYFNFYKTLDIIFSIFPNDWIRSNQGITDVIKNITQSLKSSGMLYLCVSSNNTNKCALIIAALINSNEYLNVYYQDNDQEKFYLITAQRK